MSVNPVRVGIVGLGTVGSGTFNVITRNAEDLARRVGRPIEISQIGARRDNPNCDTSDHNVTRSVYEVVDNPDVDILVELIGGTTTARELIMKAIDNGKHIVTANKALIAEYGNEIFSLAAEKGVSVAYEAAVAGGIPIIKAVREGLAANKINWLAGIINGTGNFILTAMSDEDRDFNDVLKEAQELGYAEADPTFDVEGVDAAHKLTILASIAYGIPLQFDHAFTEGISKITPEDLAYADHFGYRVKHLGITRRTQRGVELRVHPTLIPKESLIANVNGVMNAIMVDADAVGPTLYYGPGAGSEPTASAVVADIVDIARNIGSDPRHQVPALAFGNTALSDLPIIDMEEVTTAYYMRMTVKDKPGVLAHITTGLSEHSISIEAILQKEVHYHQDDEIAEDEAQIIILTQKVLERDMNAALAQIEALPEMVEPVMRMRLEHLDRD